MKRRNDDADLVHVAIANMNKKFPDLRVGQLLANMGVDLYYIENSELAEAIYKFYSERPHADQKEDT